MKMKAINRLKTMGFAVAVVLLAAVVSGGTAASATMSESSTPLYSTQYFDNSNGQNFVYLFNPSVQTVSNRQIVCDMFYVFDAHEEMQACCGCPVTNNGLRWLNVANNLAANPQTLPAPVNGVLKKVTVNFNASSGTFAPCNPALINSGSSFLFPTPGWISHIEKVTLPTGTTNRATEHDFEIAGLSTAELNSLAATCSFLHTNGTGNGICSCGGGDYVAPTSGAGRR